MDIHIKGAIISALIIALILTAAAQAFTGLPMDVVSHPFTLGNPIAVVYGCALVGYAPEDSADPWRYPPSVSEGGNAIHG